MRLTNYSDYALRTLMYLAVIPDRDTLATITDIANSYQIDRKLVQKIIDAFCYRDTKQFNLI